MPEGPEVAITADQLSFLKGWQLVKVVKGAHSHNKEDSRVYHLPSPSQFTAVVSYGKKLIFQLVYFNTTYNQPLNYWIICSLGMTGRWSWDQLGIDHTMMEFHVNGGQSSDVIIRYSDIRLMGNVKVAYTQDEFNAVISGVGIPHVNYPFGTGSGWNTESWHQLVTNKRRAEVKVGKFIKEQKYASGVGNYIRSEVLYLCRISPHRKLGELSDYEIELLRVTIYNVMCEAYSNFGKTLSDFITPDGRRGTYITKVYPNDVRNPQPNCPLGYPIVHEHFDGQTVHWVPAIQR